MRATSTRKVLCSRNLTAACGGYPTAPDGLQVDHRHPEDLPGGECLCDRTRQGYGDRSGCWRIGTTLAGTASLAQPVDTARIAAGSPNDWLTYHGAYNGWNYSGLDQINPSNVKDLAVAWIHVPGRSTRGLQSVPLVADGVLYYTGSYSRVFALEWRHRRGDLVVLPGTRRHAGGASDALAVQPRRRARPGQGVRRHGGRTADRARHEDRQGRLGHQAAGLRRS